LVNKWAVITRIIDSDAIIRLQKNLIQIMKTTIIQKSLAFIWMSCLTAPMLSKTGSAASILVMSWYAAKIILTEFNLQQLMDKKKFSLKPFIYPKSHEQYHSGSYSVK